MTLDEYASSLITDFKKTLTNFNLVGSDTNNNILAGKPAYKLVYIIEHISEEVKYSTIYQI